MLKTLKFATAAAAFALLATPAMAQEEAEEPRTTYSVTLIKLAPGADERWTEIMETYVMPASEAAGQPLPTVHWVMANNDYDLILVTERMEGMAGFDTHANPHRDAFFAAMAQVAGGQEVVEALGEEYPGLVSKEVTYFTHTHP